MKQYISVCKLKFFISNLPSGLPGPRVDVHGRCGPETGRPLFAFALCDKDRFQVGFRGDFLFTFVWPTKVRGEKIKS